MRHRSKDRDPIERVNVVAGSYVAKFNGKRGTIPCCFYTSPDIRIRKSARIRQKINGAAETALQDSFGSL